MSIGKLGASGAQLDYYERQVADGLEDYYSGRGEAPGRWIGSGASEIGLRAGEDVTADGFMLLMRGVNPLDGSVLRRMGERSKVAAIDLTFSAPKSVSVLFAVGGRELSDGLAAAHDAAVAAAVGVPGAGGVLDPPRPRRCGARARRGVRRRCVPAPALPCPGPAAAHACGGGEPDPGGRPVHRSRRPRPLRAQVSCGSRLPGGPARRGPRAVRLGLLAAGRTWPVRDRGRARRGASALLAAPRRDRGACFRIGRRGRVAVTRGDADDRPGDPPSEAGDRGDGGLAGGCPRPRGRARARAGRARRACG